MRFIQLVTLTAMLTISNSAWAQTTSSGPAPSGQAFSIHVGPLLPSSVGATDEILKGGGFRYAYPLGKGLLESGLTASNSEGVRYYDVAVSLRADIPFADMFAFGLIGANASRIMGPNSVDPNYYAGGHLGGGILAHVADTLFFRSEMRFNFHPGLILFFGFGLEYRFGSGGGNN